MDSIDFKGLGAFRLVRVFEVNRFETPICGKAYDHIYRILAGRERIMLIGIRIIKNHAGHLVFIFILK
jgi:hypothetical protein